jgi:hypothetical protein
MRAERALLRIGEYLVGRACRRLPREIRDERYREWAAELPAILHDPGIRLAPHRAVRMLGYAADTVRATALAPGRPRRRPAALFAALLGLLTVASLAVVAGSIWRTARAPEHGVNYVQLAWSLGLAAWSVSQNAPPGARRTALFAVGSGLAGVVVFSWNAAQAPADWANYFNATWLFLLAVASWLVRRWARTGGRAASAADSS